MMSLMMWDHFDYCDNIEIVAKLNKMLELDPEFTTKIVGTKFTVNDRYADSNFVCTQDGDEPPVAGIIGVLNGLIANNETYRVCATYDDDGKLIKFELLELKDGKFTVVE